MTALNTLLHIAAAIYGYSEDDKVMLRQMAKDDEEGLRAALEGDPLVMFNVEMKEKK